MEERFLLASGRIREISEAPEMPEPFADYFRKTANFLLLMLEAKEKAENGWLLSASLSELKEWNHRLYGDIEGEAYRESYANPAAAARRLGSDYGPLLSFLYAELRGMIVYAYEHREEEFLIYMELFLQIHGELADGAPADRIKSSLYWFVSDYSDVTAAYRVREQVDPALSFARDIIMTADLSDPRYLYRFGEYVSDMELKLCKYLAGLPEAEIGRIASVFTEGYRTGFLVNQKPLEKKRTVNIRYCLGFERVIRAAIRNFEAMGLQSILYRAAASRVNMREANKIGYYGSSPNKQYDYDHKGDAAVFMDKAFMERKLGVLRAAYEKYKDLADVHGGPAVMEIFGEKPFEPASCPEALHLNRRQQAVQVSLNSEAGRITNEYIKGEERSFTIIAFPVPDIGEHFEEIFAETVKINTLDYRTYQRIQQVLIDALDRGRAVRIVGANSNETDLTVALAPLADPLHETLFENCVADVNIPVGEVFTSPRLEGTNGLLHVRSVYLEGLHYRDLKLTFQEGMVSDYSCANYPSRQEGRRYIRENVLSHHETLPMGEFAIGTNTTAYVTAKKYRIAGLLPILIAEKMGPHFAVGDTCFSWEEDVSTYNPDGKRMTAKENSAVRRDLPGSAGQQHPPGTAGQRCPTEADRKYFNCHTDITIPYDELGEITVLLADGGEIPLIRDGRFVLPGTEELNEPFA